MIVGDLMTTDIVTCEIDDSLQDAVVDMIRQGTGSVIGVKDGDPVGIVTKTDALHAEAVAKRPFTEIPVKKVISHPLVTVSKEVTIRTAVDRMKREEIKRLPVVDGVDLEGIVTLSDIALHQQDLIDEARTIDQQQEHWESRRMDLDDF